MYELPHEWPNDLRLNLRKFENMRQASKTHRMIA